VVIAVAALAVAHRREGSGFRGERAGGRPGAAASRSRAPSAAATMSYAFCWLLDSSAGSFAALDALGRCTRPRKGSSDRPPAASALWLEIARQNRLAMVVAQPATGLTSFLPASMVGHELWIGRVQPAVATAEQLAIGQ